MRTRDESLMWEAYHENAFMKTIKNQNSLAKHGKIGKSIKNHAQDSQRPSVVDLFVHIKNNNRTEFKNFLQFLRKHKEDPDVRSYIENTFPTILRMKPELWDNLSPDEEVIMTTFFKKDDVRPNMPTFGHEFTESYSITSAKQDWKKISTLLGELDEYFSIDNIFKFLETNKTPVGLKDLNSEDERISTYISTGEPILYKLKEVYNLILKHKKSK